MPARTEYRARLDDVWGSLCSLAELAEVAMRGASASLTDADLGLAEQVISEASRAEAARASLDDLIFTLLATQAPVAGDLRLLTSAIPAAAGLERMGGLAVHIARAARMRYPDNAVPEPLRATMAGMGVVALELSTAVTHSLAQRSAELAARVPAGDDAMDALHRRMFLELLDHDNGIDTHTAVDLSLLGRYFERYADQAVSVARRVHFIVTAKPLPK